jgi:uncharacterized membrane protein YedE/YeeE
MFDPPARLALGLLTGIAFGLLLQKGRVARFGTILGQLLLKDWTVLKVMATAIVVGAVGVHLLADAGLASLHVKPFLVGGVLLGAVAFGVGMAVLGYCPGTSVAASGEGSRDAMAGVVGMLAGALAFVLAFPSLEPAIRGLGDLGEVTLDAALGVSPWAVLAPLAALAGGLLWWAEHARAPADRPAPAQGREPVDAAARERRPSRADR